MSRYLLKRFLSMIIVTLVSSFIVFWIYSLVPGDRAEMMVNPALKSDPETYKALVEAWRIKLSLDQPFIVQYVSWFTNLLKGDFGYSMVARRPVLDALAIPLKNTIKLNIVTLIILFGITIPLGISTAVKKNSLFDRSVQVFTAVTYSLPTIVVSLLMIYLFAIKIKLFPISGMESVNAASMGSFERFLNQLHHMFLPVMTSVIISMAGITRYIRGSMIEVLSQDYIRTARAKGLSERVVIYMHAFRNALVPVVTIITANIIGLLSGSSVIERIFMWNGMGKLAIDSLLASDFMVSLGYLMIVLIVSLVAYLIMDFVYTLVDPRIRLG